MSSLGLRKQLDNGFTQVVTDASNPAFVADMQRMEAEASNPIVRGFESAGLGMRGNALYGQANDALIAGDSLRAQELELAAQDAMRQGQVWAPTTQNFTDIRGPGDAVDWVGAQIGNLHTSLPPVIGGLAGAAAGLGVGALTKNPGLGMRVGSAVGTFIPGAMMERDESIGQAMQDQAIRDSRSAQEIRDAANVKGALAGAAESIVPFGVANSLVLGGGKKLAAELAQQGALRTIGKRATIDAGEEFLTEGAQSLIGQGTQNYLRRDDITDFDYKDAFNEAMAGAVGGGMMGGVGGTADVLHNKVGGAAEKVADVVRDPVGAVIDKMKRGAEEAGAEQVGQDPVRDREMAGEMYKHIYGDKGWSENPEQVVDSILGKKAPSVADPLRDDERDMDDATIDRTRHEQAMRETQEILKAPAGMYTAAEKEAAARFQAGEVSWDKVREIRRQSESDRKAQKDSDDLAKAFGMDEDDLRSLEQQKPETKSSLMRPTLTDDFGEQEGRAMDDDTVTDNFGNTARTSPTSDMSLPRDEQGFGSAVRRVTALQTKWDKEATKTDAERTVKVADVLVKGGYWPKEIVDAAQSVTQKESLLNQASTMLSWMKYGMNDKRHATDPESAVEVLTGKYGESAIKMLDKAYEVAVNSGLMQRDDAKLSEIKELATTSLANQKNYGDIVMSRMDPVWKAKVKGADELANLVSTVRRIASTGGTREDQRVMEILFPNAENRHEVQKALYNPSISKNTFGTESATNKLGQERGEVTVGGNKPRAVEDMDGNDFMRQAELFNDTEKEAEFEDRTVDAQGVRYISNAGGHAFRKADQKSRAAMNQAKEENKIPGARVEEVGVVKATLDKVRAKNGDALSKDQRMEVLERTVRRYMKRTVPPRPATPPAEASALTKNVHKADLAKWERNIERAAKALDRSHVVLKTVVVKEDVVSNELDYEAVRAAQLDRKLDDPRNRPEEGVMWVGTKRGAKMLISAPQVLRLAFMNRGNEHQDVGFNGKTKEGDDIQVNFGSAQNVYNTLLRSMGDISMMPQFSGEWGFVEAGGNPVQVRDTEGAAGKPGKFAKVAVLPDNFALLKQSKTRPTPLTVADVKSTKGDFSARLDGLKDGDVDPDSFGGRVKTTGPIGQMWGMLKNNDLKNDEDAPRLEKFLTTLSAGKFDRDQASALIKRWKAHLGIGGKVTEFLDGMTFSDGRAVAGLAAYDPPKNKQIVRGDADKGMVTTSNLGMQAQSTIGTAKKLDAAGVKSLQGAGDTHPLSETQFVVPTDPEMAAEISAELESRGMKPRVLNKDERNMVRAAWREFAGRGLQPFLDTVGHILTFTVSDHNALMLGGAWDGGKTVIGANAKVFNTLKPHLFQTLGAQVRYILAHEVGHSVDIGANKQNAGKYSTDPVFEMSNDGAVGAIAKEMQAAALNNGHRFSGLLRHTPFKKEYDGRPQAAQRELFAQAFAMYAERKAEMQEHLPLTYAHMENIYDETKNPVQHSARVDGRSAGATQTTGKAAAQGNNPGASESTGLQGAEGRHLGAERDSDQRGRLLTQLKTIKAKNAIHKRAVENLTALLEGKKEGDIVKAMNDMVRWDQTIGELSVRQREQLKAWVEKRGEKVEDQVPLDAYDDEYGFEPELAEMDRAAVTESTEPTQVVEDTPAQQLQAYIDANKGKNAGWEKVAAKAIAEKNEKQITGALAAAKKQFGELSGRATTRVDAGATTTASVDNLVDAAKPPAFAREKEQAKLDGADYVFAPTGVDGSFASRLGEAAKAAGKLIDPNGTENIRDKVVYVSVPGAGRGFTGMDAFLADVRKLLDRGAIIRTDTKERASSPHNAAGEGKLRQMLAFGNLNLTEGKLFDSWQKNLPRAKKDSRQRTHHKTNTTPEQQAKVEAELHRMLGDDIRILFEQMIGKAGEWTKDKTGAVIRLSTHADIMSTGFHEAMHQLFSLMKQNNGQAVIDTLQRIAMGPVMQGRLRKMLKGHPEAMAQLSDPEEAVAYMFQFWMMDQSGFKLGPEAKTLFQKIKGFFDKVVAVLSKTVRDRLTAEKRSKHDAETVEYLMTALGDGRMADKTGRTAVVQALAADAEKREAALGHLGDGYTKLFTGIGKYFATGEGLLEGYNNQFLTKVARMFHQRAGEAMGDKAGYLEEVRYVSNQKEAMVNKILAEANADDLEIAREWLSKHPEQGHPSPEINKIVQGVRAFLKDMRGYIEQKGIKRLEDGEWVPIDFRKHYFPRVWDTDAVTENKEQFLADLMEHHEAKLKEIAEAEKLTVEAVAEALLARVMNPRSQVDLDENTSDLGMTPAATAINRRELTWLDMEVFDKYMSKDMGQILHSYAHNMVQRGEYQSRFGNAGEHLKEMVDSAYLTELGGDKLLRRAENDWADEMSKWEEKKEQARQEGKPFTSRPPTLRQSGEKLFLAENTDGQEKINSALSKLEPALKTIMAMEGTLGADISPGLRKAQNWITTYQNFRVLAPGLFSSFMDVMGVVREGGEFKDAWEGFVAGIKEAKNVMLDKHDDSAMMRRAELFGTADAGTFMSVMSQHSGSIFMGGKAREWSDKLFKYNGMSGWNRGMRAYATTVAERLILSWKNEGIDTKDKAAMARVERLFGKDFDVSKIKVDADGMLDISDSANVAAVNRWVHDAVIAPNAAHRPYWMSDPHFQIFSHLKSFAYSQHAVMLKQVAAQARLGNYRPAMVTMLTYAPIAIAAGAVKEMLIPGEEPPWMQGGLDGYLQYGWDRAGVLGIPQMYGANLFDSDPVAAFGPTANQLQDLITVPFGEMQVEVPMTDMKLGWRDHRAFEEAFAAAPFGSVLRRTGKSIDDWVAS